jgi:hypothetical protein
MGAFQIVATPVLPDFILYLTMYCYSKHIPVSVESRRDLNEFRNEVRRKSITGRDIVGLRPVVLAQTITSA